MPKLKHKQMHMQDEVNNCVLPLLLEVVFYKISTSTSPVLHLSPLAVHSVCHCLSFPDTTTMICLFDLRNM
uniref:Uncharacterized protein n=1 Tax=Oryza brachyantha TaxID=4533 RepID=J3LIT8_ORYBR